MQSLRSLVRMLPVIRDHQIVRTSDPTSIGAEVSARTPLAARRYDFGAFPNGWIPLGYGHEVERGAVRAVRALGRELVMFRGNDGEVRVLDAYCPHLGAHLGVEGSVVGNEIRCPFHGWQFDGQGACTHVPHAKKIPPKAKVACWVVRELNGMIFVWHDANGREPWFELPKVPEFESTEWTEPLYYAYRIRTRWRELVENAVDRAHFHALHKYPSMPSFECETSGHEFRVRSSVPWRRFGRDVQVTLNLDIHGPGLAVTRGVGEAPFVVIGCPTPVDEETLVHRMTFKVSKKIPFPLRSVVARFVVYAARREFERDVPIWESKRYVSRPVLSDVDGPIAKFRAWTKQFENGGASSIDAAPSESAGAAT